MTSDLATIPYGLKINILSGSSSQIVLLTHLDLFWWTAAWTKLAFRWLQVEERSYERHQDQAGTLEHSNYHEPGFTGATPSFRPFLRLKRTRIMFADCNLTWSRCVAIFKWLGYNSYWQCLKTCDCLQRALGSQMKETPGALPDLFSENGCI